MKITVYSTKGWCWKTPIATNIALDRWYGIWSNESSNLFKDIIPADDLLRVDINEPFPTIPQNIDIVFDLAWTISDTALSIVSAIEQSDIVLIPINNEKKSIIHWLDTISEVMNLNKSMNISNNIVIIATKLERHKGELFKSWTDSKDYQNISTAVSSNFKEDMPIIPLKLSKIFDTIFEKNKSISQLMDSWWLYKHTLKEISQQFDEIYNVIDTYNG